MITKISLPCAHRFAENVSFNARRFASAVGCFFSAALLVCLPVAPAFGQGTGQLEATFTNATDIPLTTAGFDGSGQTVNFTLNFAPALGTRLTVVSDSGPDFIENEFDNLANGEVVGLEFEGETFWFVAWYFGGDGNDLVLVPRYTGLASWGGTLRGQLGDGELADRPRPVSVIQNGVLSNKTVVAVAAGNYHSLALCSDGTIASWGWNEDGQLGDGSLTNRLSPVAVDQTGVLAGKTVVAIAAGNAHSLALCSDGTMAAWGNNGSGELGNGSTIDSPTPVMVDQSNVLAGKKVISIAAGNEHNLALCSDGTLFSWGNNGLGQLGDGTTTQRNAPVAVNQSGVLQGKSIQSVVAGRFHSMVLTADGLVAGWGWNLAGQLGDGTFSTRKNPVLLDQSGVLNGKTVVSIVVGSEFGMALCLDGTLAGWGSNTFGQLGNETPNSGNTAPVLVDQSGVLSGKTVISIFAGYQHLLALCEDGVIASWGGGQFGQLGNGTTESVNDSPVLVDQTGVLMDQSVFTMSAGILHNLAVYGLESPDIAVEETGGAELSDGNDTIDFGSLPLVGATVGRSFTILNTGGGPLNGLEISLAGEASSGFRVKTLPSSEVAAGESTEFEVSFQPGSVGSKTDTLLISSNDPDEDPFEISLMGEVSNRTLPAGFTDASDIPLSTPGFDGTGNSVDLSFSFAPILGTRFTVVDNTSQEFIEGEFDNLANGDLVELDFNGAIYRYIAWYFGGDGNDLVLLPRFTGLAGWGRNLYGEVGDGTETSRFSPVILSSDGVLAGKTVVSIATGGSSFSGSHSVALCSDGTVLTWGRNNYGQLGDGTTTDRNSPVPLDQSGVLAGKRIVAIFAGAEHSGALCSDGTVASWGRNIRGQLGDGTRVDSSLPVLLDQGGVLSGKRITFISSGNSHVLALCSDGTLASWGDNFYGQLGDGTTTQRPAPVLVDQSSDLLAQNSIQLVIAGGFHSMVLRKDGTVASWGWNTVGQLGDGTTTDSSSPVLLDQSGVLSGKSIVSLGAGRSHNFVLCTDGTVALWGGNRDGALGDGSDTDRSSPVLLDQSGVLSGKMIRSLVGGAAHTHSISRDGTVAAWGQNFYGQLGDATNVGKLSPVALDQSGVLASAGVVAISGAEWHTLALIEVAPEISVDLAPDTELTSGSSSLDFGETQLFGQAPVDQILTIRNVGSSDLKDVQPAFTGAQPFAFSVLGALPETIAPGESVEFTVRFVPTNAGVNNATLNIQSNDRDENPFTISLTGTAISEFSWSAVEGAEWYNIYIQKDGRLFQTFWREAAEGTTWMPEVQLPAGNYKWWVRSWTQAEGSAAWIEQPEFRYANVELIAPEGSVSETRPVFEWTQSDHARQVGTTPGYYNLYIQRNGALWKNVWIEGAENTTWQQPEAQGPMPPGNYRFWVNPWNQANGVGIWSDPMECAIALPELIAPGGPLEEGDWTPEFSWTQSDSADWYQLYIQRNGGLFKALWFEGSTTTSHRETEEMPTGEYKYWVNPWSFSGGFGPWIGPKEFSIAIPVPLRPSGPQGEGETQPLFTWIGSAKHEWYQIYLQRNGAYFADPWLQSNQVVGESWDISVANPGSIPANLILDLSSGEYRWWIRTYSVTDGIGGWVEGPVFTIQAE